MRVGLVEVCWASWVWVCWVSLVELGFVVGQVMSPLHSDQRLEVSRITPRACSLK